MRGVFLVVQIIGDRKIGGEVPQLGHLLVDHHQPIRVGERDDIPQQALHQGEGGRVGADAQGQGQHSREGEAGGPEEAAEGLFEVIPEVAHEFLSGAWGLARERIQWDQMGSNPT